MQPTDPILSPDEIEALLESHPGSSAMGLVEPDPVDLLAGDRFIRDLVPLLDVGHVRLAESLQRVVTSMLGVAAAVHNEVPEIVTGRALHSIAQTAPTLVRLAVQTPRGEGRALLILDTRLTFTLIARLFGSTDLDAAPETPRAPTNLERRILVQALDPILREMNTQLEPRGFFHFTPSGVEPRLDLVPGFSPDATALHVPFSLTLGEHLASFSLAFSADLLELLRDALPSTRPAQDETLAQVMDGVPLTLTVDLGEAVLTLQQLTTLSPGQVLTLDRGPHDEVPVLIEGLPCWMGLPVHDDGAIAVEITTRQT